MSEVTKCKHGRNFCLQCHQTGDLSVAQEALKPENQRIYPIGTSRDLQGELVSSQSQLAALREELADCSSDLKVTKQALESLKGERDDLQQRLADAERRNAVMASLLREGLEEFKEGDDWIDRVVAAIAKPEEAKS